MGGETVAIRDETGEINVRDETRGGDEMRPGVWEVLKLRRKVIMVCVAVVHIYLEPYSYIM